MGGGVFEGKLVQAICHTSPSPATKAVRHFLRHHRAENAVSPVKPRSGTILLGELSSLGPAPARMSLSCASRKIHVAANIVPYSIRWTIGRGMRSPPSSAGVTVIVDRNASQGFPRTTSPRRASASAARMERSRCSPHLARQRIPAAGCPWWENSPHDRWRT